MIRRVLIADTESTALEILEGRIIEVAAILYSVTNRTILSQFSSLLVQPHDGPSHNAAESVNRISPSALDEMRELYLAPNGANEFARGVLEALVYQADFIVAHNAAFDREWLTQIEFRDTKKWICTADDFKWPRSQSKAREKLTQIAIAYDVPVVWAHRALDDCRLIAELFSRVDDLQGMFEKAMLPRSWYVANVSFDNRAVAKDAGFSWNDPFLKKWSKRLTEEEAAELKFSISKVMDTADEVLAGYGTPRG